MISLRESILGNVQLRDEDVNVKPWILANFKNIREEALHISKDEHGKFIVDYYDNSHVGTYPQLETKEDIVSLNNNGMFEWGKVHAHVNISFTKRLKTLKGCPQECYFFTCAYNENLESLEGMPQDILEFGGVNIEHNKLLKNLEGMPKRVGSLWICDNKGLTSLKGFPHNVIGNLAILGNDNLNIWSNRWFFAATTVKGVVTLPHEMQSYRNKIKASFAKIQGKLKFKD